MGAEEVISSNLGQTCEGRLRFQFLVLCLHKASLSASPPAHIRSAYCPNTDVFAELEHTWRHCSASAR